MNIDLAKLDFTFIRKPLLIGGKAMEYYSLRQAGADIDFVIGAEDHARLWQQYPEHRKELWGDLGVCIHEFEIWDSICLFDYAALSPGAAEVDDILVASPEKLLLLKAMAMRVPKYHKDLELLADYVNRRQYEALYVPKVARYPTPRSFAGTWQLDPAQSDYQFGEPPRSGLYTIEYDGHALRFTIEWTDAGGQDMRQTIDAIPNGLDHPYDSPAVDAICYTAVDPVTLDSTAKKQGTVVACARRMLLPDGNTMRITQSGTTPDGKYFDNVSVYRRV